jgi:hypothetical protein
MVLNGTPANYEYWLAQAICETKRQHPGEDRFVFINAWNEWAEGCHLEPDRRFQRQFLEATLRAKMGQSLKTSFEDTGIPKLVGPRTSVHARLDELSEEVSAQRRRLDTFAQELSTERQRLHLLYQDLTTKKERSQEP